MMMNKNIKLIAATIISTAMILLGPTGCGPQDHSKCSLPTGSQPSSSFRVMTYNILHGEGLDGKLDLDRTAEVIRRAGADVVGLNEVDNNFSDRSKFINEPEYLAEKLGMHYVYGPALILGDPEKPNLYGNALLSRYPIKQWDSHKLYLHPGHEPRTCIKATIDINGEQYTFMATHLDHQSNEVRIKQAQDIVKIVGAHPGKTILVGDFNSLSPLADDDPETALKTKPIAVILEKFQDAFVLAGVGPESSYRSGPRIDYIFVSPDLAGNVLSCAVINTELTRVASDHRPVISDIKP